MIYKGRRYLDSQDRKLFVCDGISNGRTWATYFRKPSGSLKRLVSKALPLRDSWKAAQQDLDEFAQRHKLREKLA